MIKRFLLLINSIILAFMFLGCGGGTDPSPEGSEITFGSGDIEITDGGATVWDDGYVNVIVKNEEGIPLNNVELVISYPWAAPSPGIPGTGFLVQLYDGDDNPKNSPMTVETDEYGTFYLHYGYLRGSLEYFGDLSVVSGSASASIEIKVSVPSS